MKTLITRERKIYVDMDGVIADFNGQFNAVKRFRKERGFFRKLAPIRMNTGAVVHLISKGYDVHILTTSPHKRADRDKLKWLKVNLPEVDRKKVIFARPEIPKVSYIEEPSKAILFDDYGKNIREWLQGGGYKAIQVTPRHSMFDAIVEGF